MNPQLKKGILEMCILYTISQREMYGYDIMQEMRKFFPEVNESTFYAILRRLHKEKAADTYIGEESNGPKRKYYRITEQGKMALQSSIADYNAILNIVRAIGIEE